MKNANHNQTAYVFTVPNELEATQQCPPSLCECHALSAIQKTLPSTHTITHHLCQQEAVDCEGKLLPSNCEQLSKKQFKCRWWGEVCESVKCYSPMGYLLVQYGALGHRVNNIMRADNRGMV